MAENAREYDNIQYLKRNARQREQLLRQFVKCEGPAGNSSAFIDGWERIWGKKSEAARNG